MSRHELAPHPDHGATTVTVGWDAPLDTYYVQVFAGDSVLLWYGTSPHEVADPRVVLTAARLYADLPDGLAEQLIADRAAEGDRFSSRPAPVRSMIIEAGSSIRRTGR
jgi:hypothetical protein